MLTGAAMGAAQCVCNKRTLLIVHLEEPGISGDVFYPQLLYHRLYFIGPIVFAIGSVSKLAWIYGSNADPGSGVTLRPIRLI